MSSYENEVRALFSERLKDKEAEIDRISSAISDVQHRLQMVRYGSVSIMHSSQSISGSHAVSIHPATSSLLRGKTVKTEPPEPQSDGGQVASQVQGDISEQTVDFFDANLDAALDEQMSKIVVEPCYIPPLSKDETKEPRGSQYKLKRRFVIGNVSRWIPHDDREDMSTHKWMIYVRGCKTHPDVSGLVEKVRFFIHQSYYPNNVVDVQKPPFQLTRRGWGEFPARIQIYFKNEANKPVSIVHHIKLDKTYTGLQTLGSETTVDVWLNVEEKENVLDIT